MASSSGPENELEEELKDAGNKLLMPPSSIDELLTLLDKLEDLLSKVEQAPSQSMQDALLPATKALIAIELLRHSDMDVKVSVVSCITELTRISAPDPPYSDEQMKEIFQLTIMALENLSRLSGRCYLKAVQILEYTAQVRSCLVMQDLGCDAQIVEMFKLFLKTVRPDHPQAVFWDMEAIMTLVIEESDMMTVELLNALLSSVKKDNQNIEPLSWKLGLKVLENCATILRFYLPKVVKMFSLELDDYAEVVAKICQNENPEELMVAEELAPDTSKEVGSPIYQLSKSVLDGDTTQMRNDVTLENGSFAKTLEPCNRSNMQKSTDAEFSYQLDPNEEAHRKKDPATPKKRGRKPNSLKRPEEGYHHSCSHGGRKSLEVPRSMKNHKLKIDKLRKSLTSNEPALSPRPKKENRPHTSSLKASNAEAIIASGSQHHSLPGGGNSSRGRPKKKDNTINQDGDLNISLLPEDDFLRAKVNGMSSLKEESEGMRASRAKHMRGSREKEVAAKTDVLMTPASSSRVVKKEDSVVSYHEEKQESLFRPVSGSKKGEAKDTHHKQSTEESGNKKLFSPSATKLLSQDENHSLKVPKTNYKRKLTPQEDEDLRMPHGKYGEELVGRQIKVWWPMDKKFYVGAIASFDPSRQKHKVLYDDGDEENLNLRKETWELLPDMLPIKEEHADLPSLDVLSDKPRKKKLKAKVVSSMKQEQAASSSKRLAGGSSADLSKSVAPASASGMADDSTVYTADKLKDGTTEIGPSLKDEADGHKSNAEPEGKTPRTIMKPQPDTTHIVCKSKQCTII